MTPQPTTALSAEGLHLGNWIRYGNPVHKDLPVYQITGNMGHTIYLSDGSSISSQNSNIQGIPLSPEILERCKGFSKATDNEHWFIGVYGFCLWFDGADWCLKSRIDKPYVVGYIKYLHTLQNWYALLRTGSRLTLNP